MVARLLVTPRERRPLEFFVLVVLAGLVHLDKEVPVAGVHQVAAHRSFRQLYPNRKTLLYGQ